MSQEPIYWIDEYAKKKPEELTCYATCIIDGYAWRVTVNGQTYCAGKADEIKEVS